MTKENLSLDESMALFEEAKKLTRILRKEIEQTHPPLPGNCGILSELEGFLGDVERGGLAWKFETESIPAKDVDRRKSMVTGPFFITEDYPLPLTEEGKFLLPCIQVDLRTVSELRGLPLGDGLLQAFFAFNQPVCRVVPRSVIDSQDPLPFPSDITLFDDGALFYIEDWIANPTDGAVRVIVGYGTPHIHFDTRGELGMWENMVSERELDRRDALGSEDSDEEDLDDSEDEDSEDENEEAPDKLTPTKATARLVEIVERIENARPRGDQVFGSFHGIHWRPRDLVDLDCLFAFESEFFCLSAAGNSHLMYEFSDGKPSFFFIEASAH